LPIEVIWFNHYSLQVDYLMAGRIDIAWNTNLAHVQCQRRSEGRCVALAQRDTDREQRSLLITRKDSTIRSAGDIRGKTLALGGHDSVHAAIMPVYYLDRQIGLIDGKDYQSIRFHADAGTHGETGMSELQILRAVVSGKVDAGAVGSRFWDAHARGDLLVCWQTPEFPRCTFTARAGLDRAIGARLTQALVAMSRDNPLHRPLLEAAGLEKWVIPCPDNDYDSLRAACEEHGLL
jgi:ABC-type phosphate/phosphonate transport system substrate-binding protein